MAYLMDAISAPAESGWESPWKCLAQPLARSLVVTGTLEYKQVGCRKIIISRFWMWRNCYSLSSIHLYLTFAKLMSVIFWNCYSILQHFQKFAFAVPLICRENSRFSEHLKRSESQQIEWHNLCECLVWSRWKDLDWNRIYCVLDVIINLELSCKIQDRNCRLWYSELWRLALL